MLPPNQIRAALVAIHRILIQARMMAYDEVPHERLAEILDSAEVLPILLANDRDESEFFQQMLESVGEQFSECKGIVKEYFLASGATETATDREAQIAEHRRMLAANGLKTATDAGPARTS